ncbi:hypothetical protein E0H75_12250 [Kribbella capetownensis]|uniref:Uncharacterized protein n=1 Tax=Kribbella capetownensis TaxID=1572659 RepID=A0A4R0JW16_9ACTN|nr:hypothetical protein [Kribbella capetownensis]TCC50920.1 hypothetical protein E0H75_12250 [Kribbella capetownensis]
MTTIAAPPRSPAYVRPALYAGLLLTVLATLAPLIDLATADSIGDHVRAAYPSWSADDVAKDRAAITIYLVAVGVVGLAGWLTSIVGVARNKRWARWVSTTLLLLGATIQLTDLSVGGEAYSTIVPPLHGVIGVLPSLAGLVAVVGLWRRRT